MRLTAMLSWAVSLILLSVQPGQAATRVALVIGNSGYRHVPTLLNPRNDAGDIAASLERLDFSVRRLVDATYDDMRRALLEFGHEARRADMAVVFYAGHGMEIAGENWLIPIDAAIKADADVEQEAISLKSVTNGVSGASRLGLVILDACRDNPFAAKMQRMLRTRSAVTRGLARVEPVGSVLVAYAAKDGTTASDGAARNSPFTRALLRHMETPGLEINFLFRNVRDDVMAATDKQQEPFVYGSLSREAIFLASLPAGSGGAQTAAPQPLAAPGGPAPDELAWSLIKDTGDVEMLRRFIRQFPNSPRRADAEQRIDKLADLPIDNPRPAAPVTIAPSAAPKPGVQESRVPARPARPGGNCFTFNGRQVCE
jgi:uncharacterized caspase-like protein